ncbi:cell division protein ZipA C-terminal FtsZ-binding domain-containing protein [Paracandidimonas soli]|uniref:Cell division protein ZipA n=1 Tax=Paracandidimonas soli TaxID=1917182 RepID=A0A4R3VAW5_9BURK|nr:cell division protein ZipA C-terminal FtsZ-binding domain-containing protein [Paracandidimonas soli]TCV00649.1 ZipA-like protein with FtsZ-binding domain [Paracandidimonas soli]
MSDLQIGLIALGVLLILVVVVFNWWQDRRIRARMREHFPEDENDALLGAAKTSSSMPGERREPGFASMAQGELLPDDEEEVDHPLEAVLDISFAHPVPADALQKAVHGLSDVGGKPVRIFAERDGGGHRSRLRAGESYVSLQLAVLLANRGGPLTAIEWSQLWTVAQELIAKFEGSVEAPEQDEVIQRAARLDAACAELDVQVGLALRPEEPLPLSQIQQITRDVGFMPYGRHLAWMAESGQPRFLLLMDGAAVADLQSDSVSRLDLLLDLPNSPVDTQPFSRMAGVGRDLARRLGTVLLDDQGRPVVAEADGKIDEQLAEIYARLESTGFVPGQPRTALVFS